MNKSPPSLLYLVIYNPELKPADDSAGDRDEDAEEQAHVLFYTGDNHAVSKDKVLRQVGLAKAIANFSTIFNQNAASTSVHSQSRRMITLNPEHSFWMHACFELERLVRPSRKDAKGKGKQKEPVHEYNETSLHDSVLRMQLLHGYEAFKIVHGSFTSILNTLGKEALELQLERFFTVWAWSWDLEKHAPISDYLGVRVHPLSNQLLPMVNAFENQLPPCYKPLVLIYPCVVAPKSAPFPFQIALIRRLLQILHLRIDASQQAANILSSDGSQLSPNPYLDTQQNESKGEPSSKKFLGVPTLAMNVGLSMDVRKWAWPSYLNFGTSIASKGDDKTVNNEKSKTESTEQTSEIPAEENTKRSPIIDSQALEEALSTDGQSQFSPQEHTRDVTESVALPLDGQETQLKFAGETISSQSSVNSVNNERETQAEKSFSEEHKRRVLPPFLEVFMHFSSSDPLITHRRPVKYITINDVLIAMIPVEESSDIAMDEKQIQDLLERSNDLIVILKNTIDVEQEKISTAFSSSPVQNVLQKSQYVIAPSNQLVYSSASFSSTSWHLFEGKRALELDDSLIEIYSRGQSPQDWHLTKRNVGAANFQGTSLSGNVFMEIGRKEASLVDVDNEITGVIRRFSE